MTRQPPTFPEHHGTDLGAVSSENISRQSCSLFPGSCMVCEVIDGQEYLWTGHSTSEVCIWSETDRLVGKPFVVGKTAVTAMCVISPRFVWVGTDSGNIRGLTLDTNVTPFEIKQHTIVAPDLAAAATGSRMFNSITQHRPFRMRFRTIQGSIENIPEDMAVPNVPERSPQSFVEKMKAQAVKLRGQSRAHTSCVRCIFAKGNRVWTAGGRMFSSIKVWCRYDNHLEDYFMCMSRGPCSSMVSIPWHTNEPRSSKSGDRWRLLSAHDSGIVILWDPSIKALRPLLEIETRKSPIRSLVAFETLGLMCTAHKDGSVAFGRLLGPTTQIYGFTGSSAQTEGEEDGEIYPFVPRTICEDVFGCGLQIAIGSPNSLFAISNRGAIVHWTRGRLESYVKTLRQSSNRRRLPVQAVNESVMVVTDRSKIEVGETVYDGDFARVKKGKFLSKDVIVKEAKDEADSRRAMDALVKDAHILSTVRHPNIVNIIAVCDDPPCVVMQYYEEGSLYEVLKRCRVPDSRVARRFTWEKRLTVAIDVCCGMVFLHSQTPFIIHRDLKSPNIFVEKDFNGASVGDFNLSKDTGQHNPGAYLGSVRPSNPMWLAPEIAKGESDFTIGTDLYAFGIILWELLTGRTPWDHLRMNANMPRDNFFSKIRYELLLNNRRPPIDRDEEGRVIGVNGGQFPQVEAYIQLMQDCWAEHPDCRPKSFQEVVSRLEDLRRQFKESRMSSSGSQAADGSKKSSAEIEHKSSKTPSETNRGRTPAKEISDKSDYDDQKIQSPSTKKTGPKAIPPRSPSDIKYQASAGLPKSPFDNMGDDDGDGDDDKQRTQEKDKDVSGNVVSHSAAAPLGIPMSPFEEPSQGSHDVQGKK